MKRNEEKTLEIAFWNFRVTDLHTFIHTFIPTYRASYRDARTHLKSVIPVRKWPNNFPKYSVSISWQSRFERATRSLATIVCSHRSLHSAPLRYAQFARSLRSRARSLTSLPPSVEIHESVFMLKSCFTGKIEILDVTGNTPSIKF